MNKIIPVLIFILLVIGSVMADPPITSRNQLPGFIGSNCSTYQIPAKQSSGLWDCGTVLDSSGAITGLTSELSWTTSRTATVSNCGKTIWNNYGAAGAITLTLPTAASGYNFLFVVSAAQQVHIKAGASDKIYLDGAALDDGDKVSSAATPTVGDSLSCISFQTGASAWDWLCISTSGTWTDGGA